MTTKKGTGSRTTQRVQHYGVVCPGRATRYYATKAEGEQALRDIWGEAGQGGYPPKAERPYLIIMDGPVPEGVR